jgi:hypothetical protein
MYQQPFVVAVLLFGCLLLFEALYRRRLWAIFEQLLKALLRKHYSSSSMSGFIRKGFVLSDTLKVDFGEDLGADLRVVALGGLGGAFVFAVALMLSLGGDCGWAWARARDCAWARASLPL